MGIMVRLKIRYLLLEITMFNLKRFEDLNVASLEFRLNELHLLNFGDVGLGRIRRFFQIKVLNYDTGTLLIRVPQNIFSEIWCTLSFIYKIYQQDSCLKHIEKKLHISGFNANVR